MQQLGVLERVSEFTFRCQAAKGSLGLRGLNFKLLEAFQSPDFDGLGGSWGCCVCCAPYILAASNALLPRWEPSEGSNEALALSGFPTA